jgi:pyridinium-3,5-bisthiocarboxylic acid mononucleotide nickel chelatase
MNILIIDPIGGISGDMLLGSLVHLGCPAGYLDDVFRKLGIGPFALQITPESISGISCIHVKFDVGQFHEKRTYASIRDVILPRLPEAIHQRCLRVFQALALAEAEVHGCPMDEVHFHEIGAIDSILDVVGICAALDRIGVEAVYARQAPLGSGMVDSLHGKLPVPAPATVKLLEGRKVRFTTIEGELTTPTGAAVIKALAENADPPSDLIIHGVGYGCGTRRYKDWPNLCRTILCEEARRGEGRSGYLVEADIDDMPAEDMEAALERIIGARALDATITPRIMKRGRQGMGIKAVCEGVHLQEVLRAILEHTSTIGVRYHVIERSILPRTQYTLATRYGDVRIKEVKTPEGKIRTKPEYRDLHDISIAQDIPMSQLRAEVERAMTEHRKKDEGLS